MNRLAQSRTKRTQSQTTVLGTLPIDLAPKERARLFQGLQAVVNTGDSEQDYQATAKQWPTFWPEGRKSTAWSTLQRPKFIDYRDRLRSLWGESLKNQHQRLGTVAYLLGLINSEEADSLFFTGPEALAELWFSRANKPSSMAAVSTSHSLILPVWGSVEVRFVARGDFEAALWALFRESWRARTCAQCKRYFIAEKPAQTYCSNRCYGDAKRGQRLAWWNKAGKIKRAQRKAERFRKSKKRGSQ
jgi:hypothetical protein